MLNLDPNLCLDAEPVVVVGNEDTDESWTGAERDHQRSLMSRSWKSL